MRSSGDQSKENWSGKNKRKKKKKFKGKKIIEVKKIPEKQEIWDKEEETAKLEEEAKKSISLRFHKQIHIFGKEASERIPMRKMLDHTIDMKKQFLLRKREVYLLFREERGDMCKFIDKQLRKEYIRPSKLSQTTLVFSVGER